ncbi:Flp pilus assembly protein CpaB [Tropicimonas isoalkanivorans]|uniref:Pilus assembly protein CpaB n=1 Tax=Tropicimonas isoalkanivorans TaxID=441112 RepID=A0A1I1IQ52_9RHOB|nr:Flp pilus assembly protein CpaB [Tropicimonas isoalkanivorans]SFC38407.1 pilus assembly protein CpaB [Tropicimonas isoalkanivorans]
MRIIFAIVLVVGIALAGFAVYTAQNFMSNMSAERDALLAAQRDAPPMVDVVVMLSDKEYGQELTKEDVKWVRWQKDSVPAGAFVRDVSEFEDTDVRDANLLFPTGMPDRFVIDSMKTFEPLLASKVTEPGEDAGITSRLSKGMRAFAIRVDVTSGVSGFLRPGDRVDVYWTGNASTNSQNYGDITKLIETNVKLIAVDQISDTARVSPVIARTVTIEASPQQVAALAQAQSTGRLTLSLVGAKDDTVAQVSQVDQKALLGLVDKAPEVILQKQVCTTKIRRGAEVIEQEIPCVN